jgi:hypothetical protein
VAETAEAHLAFYRAPPRLGRIPGFVAGAAGARATASRLPRVVARLALRPPANDHEPRLFHDDLFDNRLLRSAPMNKSPLAIALFLGSTALVACNRTEA